MKLPYSKHGVKVLNSGLNLIFEIPRLKVVITFGIIGFSVNLPYQYFGRNTQGHCGKTPFHATRREPFLSYSGNILHVLPSFSQERALTTRLMTACCLEGSWWKVVL